MVRMVIGTRLHELLASARWASLTEMLWSMSEKLSEEAEKNYSIL